MGTRSSIGIQHHSGWVTAVYCHWDGYPEHVGLILYQHYDSHKAKQLMELGNISTLAPEIGTKHHFDDNSKQVCTAYGRDRGDEEQEATDWADVGDWYSEFGMGAQHYYLLRPDGTWMWRDRYDKADWMPVEDYLAKKKLIAQKV